MARVIFHIDLDAFFASVEQLLNPGLRGKAVVVKGPGEHRTVVAAASYEARPFGVKAGMPVTQARRLCPHGLFVTGRAGVYADFSERVFSVCRKFSPLVEPASIDEGYIDMTGTDRRYDGPPSSRFWPVQAAQGLKLTIRRRIGLNCSIGIGSNKLIAKIASSYAKPNGIAMVLEGFEKRFLTPLPVETLPGIGKKSLACLAALDVRTVGDMQALPVNLLKGIFGAVGEDFYYLAHGLGSDRIEEPEDPKSVSRGTTLQRDTFDENVVKRVMRELVEDVGRQLRALGFWGRLVTLQIRYGDFTTVGHQGPLANLTNLDHEIYPAVCRLFDRLYDRRRSIRLVCVGVSRLARQPIRQMELWTPDRHDKYQNVYQAFDRIRSRYGEKAIGFGKETDEAKCSPSSVGD